MEQSLEKDTNVRDDDDMCLLDKLTNERSQMSEGVTTSRGGRTRRGSGPHGSRPTHNSDEANINPDGDEIQSEQHGSERLLNINDALDKSLPQFTTANYIHHLNSSLNMPSDSEREAPSLK